MYDLIEYEVSKRFGGMIGWGIGGALFALMYTAFFPSSVEQFGSLNLDEIAFYQAFGNMSMATFEGYFTSTIANFLPILLAVYAILAGTQAIAGEDNDGTLEMIVTLPLRRWQVILAKGMALTVVFLGVTVISGVGSLAGYAYVLSEMAVEASVLDVALISLNVLPITLFFVMLSLFLGALLPSRRLAAVSAAVLLVISYFGNNLLAMVEGLADLRVFLPFYYYNAEITAFTEGIALGDVAVLLLASLVALLLAVVSFQRREITVGG
jgi:ABC-2 type transport system permease protein